MFRELNDPVQIAAGDVLGQFPRLGGALKMKLLCDYDEMPQMPQFHIDLLLAFQIASSREHRH